MDLSNTQQAAVLFQSLLFGVGLGAAYDLLRCRRVWFPSRPVTLFFQDLFWFLFAAIASFVFIFEVNDGTVRLFILIAFLTGGLAWRATLGHLLLWGCGVCKRRFVRWRTLRKEKKKTHTQTSEYPGKEEDLVA